MKPPLNWALFIVFLVLLAKSFIEVQREQAATLADLRKQYEDAQPTKEELEDRANFEERGLAMDYYNDTRPRQEYYRYKERGLRPPPFDAEEYGRLHGMIKYQHLFQR